MHPILVRVLFRSSVSCSSKGQRESTPAQEFFDGTFLALLDVLLGGYHFFRSAAAAAFKV